MSTAISAARGYFRTNRLKRCIGVVRDLLSCPSLYLPTLSELQARTNQPKFTPHVEGTPVTLDSGESKWQPLDGSKRIVRKSAKMDGQNRSETDSPKSAKTSEKVQKRSKTSKNTRKSAKAIGVLFVDRFNSIFQWPYSGGHLGFPYRRGAIARVEIGHVSCRNVFGTS